MKEKRFLKYLALILVFVQIVSVGFLADTVSASTPLTVEQAIDNQGLNNQTVRGYIIGTVGNGPQLVTSGHVNSNLMLASSQGETDVAKMLPVQLPKTAVRTAWNLKDHPENLGKQVDVTGNLTAYFSAPGLKNTSSIVEVESSDPGDPPSNPDDPPASVLTIAEGRLESGSYTTSGIVTMVDGKSITIQDETAGIVLRLRDYDGSIKLGDMIEATGSNGDFRGLLQLNETSYSVKSSDNPLPAAQEITLSNYLADPESYESERIKIKNATLVSLDTAGNSLITADGTQINIYKIPAGEYKAGNIVNVTAIAAQYNDYQLRVADASHVEIVDGSTLEDKIFTTNLPDPITEQDILDFQTSEGITKIYNVKEAAALKDEAGKGIYVIGVVTYSYSGGSSLIIQDIIEDNNGRQIFGYQIYGPTEEVQPGDIVLAKGNAVLYYGLPELSNVESMKTVGSAAVFEPQEITVQDIVAYGDQFVNEYVLFKDLELPVYDGGSG